MFLTACAPGEELDKRDVPKCSLAKSSVKGGKNNNFPRSGVMRHQGFKLKVAGFAHLFRAGGSSVNAYLAGETAFGF